MGFLNNGYSAGDFLLLEMGISLDGKAGI